MVDLDALRAELEAAGFTVSAVAAGVLFASKPIRDDGRRVEWCVSSEGVIKADARIPGKHGWGLVPFDERTFAEYAIIARHVAPVVTPEPDAEVRDVLAEGLQAYAQQFSDHPVLPMYTGHADAGLAALRARGFAVVRTADVEAVVRFLDSQRDIWDEQASRACDALEEAIR